MRLITLTGTLFFVGSWIFFGAYFVGAIDPAWFGNLLAGIDRPTSTAELGDSFAVLGGLYSAVAVVLGLVAVLIQGRELRLATNAQTDQSRALLDQVDVLLKQVEQQNRSNMLSAYAARLQYLRAEMERLDTQIEHKLLPKAYDLPPGPEKKETWDIIKNSRARYNDYKDQAKLIDERLQALLESENVIATAAYSGKTAIVGKLIEKRRANSA